ncbi:hypothetical protein AB0N17_03675 [Streptomyces sp. NPDC051133]|uniref:hypothetical protein n=1 Tax=Streptomyces sp. NPDC051133 TaxID=3155521 RepID=UPI003433D1AF
MRAILLGALLAALLLAFGHTVALLAAAAVAYVTAQPIALGFALGALSRPALTRRVSS